jgi:hypothetical protein
MLISTPAAERLKFSSRYTRQQFTIMTAGPATTPPDFAAATSESVTI